MKSAVVKKRDSNFELLRIIAMFAIIGYHFYLQTPIYTMPADTFSHFAGMLLGSFGRAAVNLFVMIGAWHLMELPFRSIRIVRLYLTALFYTVTVSGIVVLLSHADAGTAYKVMIRAVFPFTASPLWFISDYLFLLLLSPFLNLLIHGLSRKSYCYLTAVLLLVFSVIPTIANLIPGLNVYKFYIVKSDMGWMTALYLIVGYLKIYPPAMLNSGKVALNGTLLLIAGCAALCFLDCFLLKYASLEFSAKKVHAFLEFSFFDLSSVFNVMLSVLMFELFRTVRFSSAFVNAVAKQTLGIYILHQVPVFIPVMWGFFRIDDWMHSPCFILWELLTVLAVFAGCGMIEYLRSRVCVLLSGRVRLDGFTGRWDSCVSDIAVGGSPCGVSGKS